MSEIEEVEGTQPGHWCWGVDFTQFLFGIDVSINYVDICIGPLTISWARKQK